MNVPARRCLLASVGVIAIMAAACSASDSGVTATEYVALPTPFERGVTLDPVTELPAVDAVAWGPCEGQDSPWECGEIEVPLDYRRPTVSGALEIALTRLPATGAEPIGSLVLNPGGPGASGIDLAWSLTPLFPDDLLEHFDLVGFDPRGVGRSTAVDCGDHERTFQ